MPTIPNRRLGHIFRVDEGHLQDTPENRKLLLDLAKDQAFLVGQDRYGHSWYARTLEDGTQLWATLRGDEILNGGLNRVARRFDGSSGLSRPEKKR